MTFRSDSRDADGWRHDIRSSIRIRAGRNFYALDVVVTNLFLLSCPPLLYTQLPAPPVCPSRTPYSLLLTFYTGVVLLSWIPPHVKITSAG